MIKLMMEIWKCYDSGIVRRRPLSVVIRPASIHYRLFVVFVGRRKSSVVRRRPSAGVDRNIFCLDRLEVEMCCLSMEISNYVWRLCGVNLLHDAALCLLRGVTETVEN